MEETEHARHNLRGRRCFVGSGMPQQSFIKGLLIIILQRHVLYLCCVVETMEVTR